MNRNTTLNTDLRPGARSLDRSAWRPATPELPASTATAVTSLFARTGQAEATVVIGDPGGKVEAPGNALNDP